MPRDTSACAVGTSLSNAHAAATAASVVDCTGGAKPTSNRPSKAHTGLVRAVVSGMAAATILLAQPCPAPMLARVMTARLWRALYPARTVGRGNCGCAVPPATAPERAVATGAARPSPVGTLHKPHRTLIAGTRMAASSRATALSSQAAGSPFTVASFLASTARNELPAASSMDGGYRLLAPAARVSSATSRENMHVCSRTNRTHGSRGTACRSTLSPGIAGSRPSRPTRSMQWATDKRSVVAFARPKQGPHAAGSDCTRTTKLFNTHNWTKEADWPRASPTASNRDLWLASEEVSSPSHKGDAPEDRN